MNLFRNLPEASDRETSKDARLAAQFHPEPLASTKLEAHFRVL
jgi:hypothetical protein